MRWFSMYDLSLLQPSLLSLSHTKADGCCIASHASTPISTSPTPPPPSSIANNAFLIPPSLRCLLADLNADIHGRPEVGVYGALLEALSQSGQQRWNSSSTFEALPRVVGLAQELSCLLFLVGGSFIGEVVVWHRFLGWGACPPHTYNSRYAFCVPLSSYIVQRTLSASRSLRAVRFCARSLGVWRSVAVDKLRW